MSSRWTWHGGGLSAARAQFGDGPWLDLSTGINPHAWPGAEALSIDWRRLPDEADLRALEQVAADRFGADPRHVCAVPGTEIGLRLTGGLIDGGVIGAPSYRTHYEMMPAARPIAFDRIAQADGETLLLANPNNPDGRQLNRAAMLDLLDRRGDGWLLVDEAFADADPRHSLVGEVDEARRLIVFRSFGKFFGLAGLRLGFVIGPSSIVEPLRRKLGAWPLSAAALAIGSAAYRDEAWIAAMRPRLAREAEALDAMISGIGLTAIGACPLFRLIEVDDAMALFERLARRAILTRPFEDQPRWLRIGLPGDANGLARLEAALRDG